METKKADTASFLFFHFFPFFPFYSSKLPPRVNPLRKAIGSTNVENYSAYRGTTPELLLGNRNSLWDTPTAKPIGFGTPLRCFFCCFLVSSFWSHRWVSEIHFGFSGVKENAEKAPSINFLFFIGKQHIANILANPPLTPPPSSVQEYWLTRPYERGRK